MLEVFTCEYTHNKRRGLLTALCEGQQDAERGFKRTVALMTGKEKQLHGETLKKHDNPNEANKYAVEFAKSLGKPAPTDASIAENGKRVFPEPVIDTPDEKDDE
jgi:hypothetical protein